MTTWAEFVAKVEALGIKPDDRLAYIDWSDDLGGDVQLTNSAPEGAPVEWAIT